MSPRKLEIRAESRGKCFERRFVPRTTPAVRGSTTVAMTIIQSFVLLLLWAAALAYAAYRGYKIFITLLVRARTTQIIAAPRSRSSFAPPDLTGVDSR